MKIKNKLLSILLVPVLGYSTIGVESPSNHENSPLLFDSNTTVINFNKAKSGNENQREEGLMGDSELDQEHVSIGDRRFHNFGDTNLTKSYDEHGIVVYHYANGDEYNASAPMSDTNKAELERIQEEYRTLSALRAISDQNQTLEERRNRMITSDYESYQLKKKNLELNDQIGESLAERKVKYTGSANANGASPIMSLFTSDTEGLIAKNERGEELTPREQNDLNTTLFYKNNVKSNPDWDRNEHLINENTTALSAAYQDITAITSELLSRLRGGIVKCSLSRNLIPSFYCPMIGKNNLRFPDPNAGNNRKIDLAASEKECNDICISDPGFYPVISKNILNDISFNMPVSTFEIFPTFDVANKSIILDNDDRMPLGTIGFEFSIPNPANSGLTDLEWENKLLKVYKPIMKVSIFSYAYYYDKNGQQKEALTRIYDNYDIHLNKSHFKLSLPLNSNGFQYKVVFKTPFFNKRNHADEFRNMGGTITLSDFTAEYTSTAYHYCSIKQFVPYPGFCFGGEENVIAMEVNGQDMFLCLDREHRKGPELTTGAFFSETRAARECRVRTQCKVTYVGSNNVGSNNAYYESKIGCVDDPMNTACNDELCERLFQNPNQPILNEYLLNLDTEDLDHVYTIRNGARTKEIRPKINFAEVTTVTQVGNNDYEKIFRNEEKDSAYIYMVDNLTYNRIKYRIGVESPARTAYKLYGSDYVKGLKAILKPGSFDYTENSDFYVYAVAVTDHIINPVAGSWIVNNSEIHVTTNEELAEAERNNETIVPITFRDRTYSIKTGYNNEDWEVYRRILFDKYYLEKVLNRINPETGVIEEYNHFEWIDIPAYKVDKFEKYISSTGTFAAYSIYDEAPYFDTVRFNSSKTFYEFDISSDMTYSRDHTPGLLVRDQAVINHGTYFERLYNVNYDLSDRNADSTLFNTNFYLVYSDHKLTYEELQIEIEGEDYLNNPLGPSESKWSLYNMVNKINYFRDKVPDDGEINNGIVLFKKGPPENITFSVDWTPSRKEKGSKVFKYVFLFNDNEVQNFEFQ